MLYHAQPFTTPCSLPGSFAHGIFQARILEQVAISSYRAWNFPGKNTGGLPCPPPEALLDPGTEPEIFMSPALAGGFFTTGTIWEAQSFADCP